jgi:asparagine synthase (glutamine-hydrolysing)
MCGIAGIASGGQTRAVSEMLSRLGHRGPDDRALHVDQHHSLGHARLSIIDVEGGKQPMSDPQGQSHVVFNGEIYNYQDLRRDLSTSEFSTNSDTEVLLHLGGNGAKLTDWVPQLDGMFAFAIAQGDGVKLARDPLGIKPLYVGERDGALAFASEIKSLLAVCDEVREFPAGHVYSPEDGLQRYYQLRSGPPEISDPEIAQRDIRRLLEEAVKKRMLADVPVGVFLSGGLDSSVTSALARRHKDPLDSFFVGTEDSLDRRHARTVAEYLETRHHESVYTIEEALAALPEVIYFLESFDCALVRSAVPNYFLARLASRHVKVALSGEGADECFAGYHYLKQFDAGGLHEELNYITNALHNTNLQRCDRMSMAHGLEVRVPFLDVKVTDYASRVDPALKLHGPEQTEKWVLRKVAEELLPAEIAWRRKEKFAIGAGLGDRLARHAEARIGDEEFARERELPDGQRLRSKEELFYYRIFREQYPAKRLLPLVGRSRSV